MYIYIKSLYLLQVIVEYILQLFARYVVLYKQRATYHNIRLGLMEQRIRKFILQYFLRRVLKVSFHPRNWRNVWGTSHHQHQQNQLGMLLVCSEVTAVTFGCCLYVYKFDLILPLNYQGSPWFRNFFSSFTPSILQSWHQSSCFMMIKRW